MTPYWKQTEPMSGMSYTSTPPPPQTISTTPQYLYTVAMWCIQEEGPESPDSFILLCFFTISLKPKFL